MGWQLDLTIFMAYIVAMKIANIAEFKNRISEFISAVEKGEEVEVRKRNVPIARVIPIRKGKANVTKLGCGRGTGRVLGDLTEPLIPEDSWEMLRESKK
jgi:prevent-host-death family protein